MDTKNPILSKNGDLTLIDGPMFGDKTTTLIALARGYQHVKNVTAVKPSVDNRYHDTKIVSHNNDAIDAVNVNPTKLMEFIDDYSNTLSENIADNNNEIFLIDEGHFFKDLAQAVSVLRAYGVHVVVAGLDKDFRMVAFPEMAVLQKLAKNHIRCRAYCVCGEYASYTKMRRSLQTADNLVVGGADKYAPWCGKFSCEDQWN